MVKKIYSKWHALMKACYDYACEISKKDNAVKILAGVSFIESSIFPIPPDVFLIPIVLNKREKYLKIATVCTLASVFGGILGYFIGYFLFDLIAVPVLNFYDYMDAFLNFRNYYNEYGIWIVFFAGVTPFPYKVITIASGALGLYLPIFIVASMVSRALRFYFVSFLIYKFGEKAKDFIEKHLGWLSILFFVILFASFLIIKML
ncbi:MAG: SNARE associated Golgi protein [Alphaproteobacteria bacterium ADurb.Bin438]|nr:MAG: SNARE associated Golgi protein [Alphaproteobacteria bacterium ADurb.Bin438]